jgi:hypothetical protein
MFLEGHKVPGLSFYMSVTLTGFQSTFTDSWHVGYLHKSPTSGLIAGCWVKVTVINVFYSKFHH